MVKILANDGMHATGKRMLEDEGYLVDTEKIPQEELPERLPAYDAIIVRSATKVPRDLIEQCPQLKAIGRAGVGLDNIDVEYASEKGIPVFNTPGASSCSVAELAFGHMFSLARMLNQSNRSMPIEGDTQFKALKKSYSSGIELKGKTLGIIGLGRIGQEVARIGLGLQMNVQPCDAHIKETKLTINLYNSEDSSLSVRLKTVPLDQVLQNCDFLSLHIPSSGRPIIGAEELAKMKSTAFIINTSRGGIVDEQALIEALKSGQIAGAGLDVFENEPTPKEALLRLPNVSLSPHIGASTQEAQEKIGMELAQKFIKFFKE